MRREPPEAVPAGLLKVGVTQMGSTRIGGLPVGPAMPILLKRGEGCVK